MNKTILRKIIILKDIYILALVAFCLVEQNSLSYFGSG